MIIYFLCSFITLIILFFVYIRLKYRFWAIQPVFHFYDFHYWFRNIGVILTELPQKNKFTNFLNVKTFSELSDNQWRNITAFIQVNYLRNNHNTFHPKLENIQNYFMGHSHPFYWSFYQIKEMVQNGKNVIENEKIIGVMSSRPLTCVINENAFQLYYVDYLCVDKQYRNKNIAPQIIQTHEYNQRHSNKKISVSLFKREEELTGIIPLTCYDTYCYRASSFVIDDENFDNRIKLITGDKQNIHYFYHFIKENSHKWDIYILPSISNLYQLVQSGNILIKMLVMGREIVSAYVFKKTCIYLDKGQELFACIASINGSYLNRDKFIDGFSMAISSLKLNFISIENISDNVILNEYTTDYLIKSPTAYFFYNFAYSPFKSKKCLIIN